MITIIVIIIVMVIGRSEVASGTKTQGANLMSSFPLRRTAVRNNFGFLRGRQRYEALIEVKGIETQKIRLSPVFVR